MNFGGYRIEKNTQEIKGKAESNKSLKTWSVLFKKLF